MVLDCNVNTVYMGVIKYNMDLYAPRQKQR